MFSYMLSSLGMLSRRSKLIIHSCKATSAKQMDNSQKVSIEFNRLAWLGDSVLRLATSVYLYNTRPHNSNGELAVARDRLVSNYILSYLGKKKGITCTMQSTYFEKLRLLPPGYEAASKEFYKIISLQNIQVADIVEALIGAHTLTGGLIGGINLMKWLGVMICNDSVPTLHTHVPHTQSILFADSSQIFSSYFGSPPPPSLTVSDKERHSIMSEMSSIEKGLQYTFKNKLLLIDAMTHSSYTCDGTLKSRLKFLGDAILDYLVTCHVHVFQQEFSSVRVHVLKSAIFRDSCFAELAVSLNLHKCLRHNSPQLLANMTSYRERLEEKKNEELGIKFEEISMNSDEVGAESLKGDDDMTHPPKSLRECFVSLAGAVFIDSGMNLQTVWKTFSPLLEPLFEKFKCNVPMMPVLELNHHDHNMTVKKKQYRGCCYVIEIDDKNIREVAIAHSVKIAQNVAAAKVLKKLKEMNKTNEPPVDESYSINYEEFKNYFNNYNKGRQYNVSIDLNRLEFLGDSFLKLATSVYLYNTRPHYSKRELAQCRARQVHNNILSNLGKERSITYTMQSTDFEKLPLLPPGYEAASKEFYKIVFDKNLKVADTVKALVGAHTLTGGLTGGINLMKWLGVMISNDSMPTLHAHVPCSQSILFADSSRIFSSYFGSPPPPSLTVSDKERHSIMSEMSSIERGIQYTFKNKLFLIKAMTHSSYACDGALTGTRRLKFLGNAVLDYLVTCLIFEQGSFTDSGKASQLRLAMVRNSCFTELAISLNLHKYLRHKSRYLSKNMTAYAEVLKKGKNKELGMKFEEISMNNYEVVAVSKKDDMNHPPKSLGGCFESLAGAVFIDSGMNLQMVWKTFSPSLEPLFEKFKSNAIMPMEELNFHVHNMTVKKELYHGHCYVIEIHDKNICEIAIAHSHKIAKSVAAAKVLKKLKETNTINGQPVDESSSVNEKFENYFNNITKNKGTNNQQQGEYQRQYGSNV